MKLILPLLIMVFSIVSAYPIQSLREHIVSGNLDYVNRYIQNLSEREINQPDFQFLNGYMLTDGNESAHIYSQIELTDLSGHIAPVLLYKKGNIHYINNEFNLAISPLKELIKKYDTSDYLLPSMSLIINSYLQLDITDSAQYYLDWAKENILDYSSDKKLVTTAHIETVDYKSNRKFTIQIGAFGKKINANQSVEKFKNSDYKLRIDEINVNGKKLFAVRYGYYQTKDEAQNIQKQIKNDLAIKTYLRKLE
jgi:hypothetical protein